MIPSLSVIMRDGREVVTRLMASDETNHAGGQASFIRQAIDVHDAALRRFLRRTLRDGEDADDVLQETYARLLQRSQKGGIEDFPRSYLFMIATNIIRDMRRRAAVRMKSGVHEGDGGAFFEAPDPVPTAETALIWRDGANIVHRALASAKPDHVRIFWLHWGEGLTFPEISRQTGIPLRTVERYASQTLQRCRKALEEKKW